VQPFDASLSAKEYLNPALQTHALGLFFPRDLQSQAHIAHWTREGFSGEICSFHNVMLPLSLTSFVGGPIGPKVERIRAATTVLAARFLLYYLWAEHMRSQKHNRSAAPAEPLSQSRVPTLDQAMTYSPWLISYPKNTKSRFDYAGVQKGT
jgi:hypothetical protein